MENYSQLKQELMRFEQNRNTFGGRSVLPTQEFDDSLLKSDATLKQADLLKPEYNNVLRDYMVERKGTDYQSASPDKVVDDFVEQMRYFNANVVSTAGEVRFISKADERQKEIASRAYQIYDRLGNVFVNDGFAGAVEGVAEYIGAAASDPTNYIGLLTGGVARGAAVGTTIGGKAAIRKALTEAGRSTFRATANQAAAKEAAERAGIEAARRLVREGYNTRVAGGVYKTVAERVEREGLAALGRQARTKALQAAGDKAAKRSLLYTTALDSSFAMLQDVQIQNVMLDVGAQEEYSKLQTGFSALAGGIAGLAQLGFGKFRGASGLADTGDPLEKVSNAVIEASMPKLNKEATEKATGNIVAAIKTWSAKVQDGKQYDAVPVEVIREIILGKETRTAGKVIYEGGVLEAFKNANVKFSRNETISDVMTNFVRYLDDSQLKEINDALQPTGIKLGELSETRVKLGDLLAKDISQAGKVLNTMSIFRRQVDAQLVAATDAMDAKLAAVNAKETIDEALDSPNRLKYMQSVWKRLLVSSPATTMANVAGFTQYYAGQTLADLFNATTLVGSAMLKAPFNKQGASEALRQARALSTLQAQKLRNLMDPYTTHDAYLNFLKVNPDVEKLLFETVTSGIERTSRRFGVNPEAKWFKRTEAFANGANIITGVRVQDSFTKSQMFMGELDKYLRLKKGTTLREAMQNGTVDAIDDDVLNAATDTTLRSVFAKDYTTQDQPELLRSAASLVEKFSATPVLGTILPFGRFFNNVLATAYQWTPLAAPELLIKFGYRTIKGGEKSLTEADALSRMLVGTTALGLAAQYDKGRREKGLDTFEVETAGGTIIDAKNTYPFSLFLALGRAINLKASGESIPKELQEDALIQLGVGQLARDAQFGNDLYNLFDLVFNGDEGSARGGQTAAAFAKTFGNFAAGFTRPLDAVNKIAGFAMETDTVKDIRQAGTAGETFSLSATKYIDNILEAFIDKTDSITGEELRVGTREGELYDPNPFARIFGVTVVPGRTATEKAYSMSQMHKWTANERSNLPAYDRIFNTMLAPLLEQETQQLMRSKQFQQADLNGRRTMLKNRLTQVRAEVRSRMEQGYAGGDGLRLRLVSKVSRKGTKEQRNMAMNILREDYNVQADINDLNIAEIDLLDDILNGVIETHKHIQY